MSAVQKKVAKVSDVQGERATQSAEETPALDPVFSLQRAAGNQAVLRLLSGGTVLQKKPKEGAGDSGASAQAESNQEPVAAGPSLIVEDDADVKPGQMRKSDFLSQLRTAATSAAETALAGTMWSAMGCPYIDRWLDHYSKQPSAYLERALRKYVPEAASVHSASDYIPLVQQRLRRGIEEWRSTGEVKDLPPEFASGGMPGMTAGGLLGGLIGGAVSAIGGAISSAVSGIGSALSSVGSMLFKRHEGAKPETTEDPAQIRAELGGGQSLDGATQRRMQSAFGVDFAGVRVHTDTRARELTEGMQARAFTIGSDIAFGGEEYKPGTPVGDALLAHELAHVVQQGGGNAAAGAQHKGGDSGSLEEDADRSAVGAVVKLWSGARGELSQLGQQAMPRMRSGLRLQGCGSSPKKTDSTTPGAASKPVALSGDWAKDVETARPKDETKPRDEAMMLALVKQALGTKFDVNVATQSSKDQESPKDYKKAPAINFDPKLDKKKKYNKDTEIGKNPGHSFDVGNDIYAVIGPYALDPATPLVTKMYAEHELYHTTHHLGAHAERQKPGDKPLTKEEQSVKDDSQELETWTVDFINYFQQYASLPREGRPLFGPLLDYYSTASPAAKSASLAKLKAYYDNPVSDPKEAEKVQQSMSVWVYRWKTREATNRKNEPLSKELIDDLMKIVREPKKKK